MAPTITIVTVDNKVEKAKNIVAILGKVSQKYAKKGNSR